MRFEVETITVTESLGGCPQCGDGGADLVELVFRDGTVPDLHEPINQPLTA